MGHGMGMIGASLLFLCFFLSLTWLHTGNTPVSFVESHTFDWSDGRAVRSACAVKAAVSLSAGFRSYHKEWVRSTHSINEIRFQWPSKIRSLPGFPRR